jgi:hypothetical protein
MAHYSRPSPTVRPSTSRRASVRRTTALAARLLAVIETWRRAEPDARGEEIMGALFGVMDRALLPSPRRRTAR